MFTQTKKSADNTRKLNRRAIRMRAPLALIILLTVFLTPQRSASTQEPHQDTPGRDEPTRFEMINGRRVVPGEVLVRFSDADELQLQTLVDNAASLVNATERRNIFPGLNMFHMRSNSMNTQALLKMMSNLPGVLYAEP